MNTTTKFERTDTDGSAICDILNPAGERIGEIEKEIGIHRFTFNKLVVCYSVRFWDGAPDVVFSVKQYGSARAACAAAKRYAKSAG